MSNLLKRLGTGVVLIASYQVLFTQGPSPDCDALLYRNELDSAMHCYLEMQEGASTEMQVRALAGQIRCQVRQGASAKADSLLQIGQQWIDGDLPLTPAVRADLLLARGEYLRANSQLPEALRQFLVLAQLSPEQAPRAQALGLFQTGLTYERIGRYDSCLHYMEAAYPRLLLHIDTTSMAFSELYNGLGIAYYRGGALQKAESFFLKSRDLARREIGWLSRDVAVCMNNLSSIARSQEDYGKAIGYAEQSLRIYELLQDEQGASGAQFSLGIYHYFTGDYGRAQDYLRACASTRRALLGKQHYSLIGTYEVLGITYEETGNYEKTLDYLGLARRIIQHNFEAGSLREGYNYENTALTFQNLGQLDSAQYYMELAHRILVQQLPPTDYALATHYYNFASILYDQDRYAAALRELDRSDAICQQLDRTASATFGQNLALRALLLWELRNEDQAAATFAAALRTIRQNNSDSFLLSPITLEVLNPYLQFLYQRYQRNGGQENLQQFEQYGQHYLLLSNRLRRQFLDPYTKRALSRENVEVYSRLLGAYQQLYQQKGEARFLRACYEFAEYNRAALLRDLLDSRISSYAGIPDSVLHREQQLRQQVATLQQQVLNRPDSSALGQALFASKETLNSYAEDLLQRYPRYHELRFNDQLPQLDSLQAAIAPDQAFIEYMQDDTAFYALLVTAEDLQLLRLGERDTIERAVEQWRTAIQHLDAQALQRSGWFLHTLLWNRLQGFLPGKRVSIIPVGVLFYLNFDALPTGRPDQPYLLHEYQLSYGLSLSTLLRQSQSEVYRGPLLSIAPGFEPDLKAHYRNSLDSLQPADKDYLQTVRQPHTLKLVAQLERLFRQRSFTAQQATEAQVRTKLGEAPFIFMGTHAIADADDPLRSRLLLAQSDDPQTDGYLHAYELFGIPMRANLAILNACESGLGQLRDGEGMISLAYAFQSSGCPSTLMSLWKVDERSSSRITRLFLEGLAAGRSSADALRTAKLTYLKEAPEEMQHPFYWSGLVLMGPDRPLPLQRRPTWYYWAGGILVASMLLGALWQSYRS